MALPPGATLFSRDRPNMSREQFYNPDLRNEEQRRMEQDARNRIAWTNEHRRVTAERGIQDHVERGAPAAGGFHKKSKRKNRRKVGSTRRTKNKTDKTKKSKNKSKNKSNKKHKTKTRK